MDKYKLQPRIKRSFSELFKCYKDVIKKFVLVVGPLIVVSFPVLQVMGWDPYKPAIAIKMGGNKPVGSVFSDRGLHKLLDSSRLLHSKWGYEKIHYVHHEYMAPIGFAAPYAHWAEILVLGIPTFLGPAIVPCHLITLWLWSALRQAEAIETHSGYNIPWSPTKLIPFYGGAEYHDYHHYVGRQSQSNFASAFTYCDYIYGTDKGYRHHNEAVKKFKEQVKEHLE